MVGGAAVCRSRRKKRPGYGSTIQLPQSATGTWTLEYSADPAAKAPDDNDADSGGRILAGAG
jgi:hypothetical protein